MQPALTADGDVLINTLTGTGGLGIRRLNVAHGSGGWTVDRALDLDRIEAVFQRLRRPQGPRLRF